MHLWMSSRRSNLRISSFTVDKFRSFAIYDQHIVMTHIKSQSEILSKLGIPKLNPMQEEAGMAIDSNNHVILLSPTGTGKTLAFLLPVIANLNPEVTEVQTMIIVPSRELALQIEQVLREMGTGYKVNAIYGGRTGSKDKIDLQHPPAVLIGTPGRIADRIRRRQIDTKSVTTLILDEFDKSLEVGFEDEMKEITQAVRRAKKVILTSATEGVEIPKFVNLQRPAYVDYLKENNNQLTLKKVVSPDKDKLRTLVNLLNHIGDQPGIVFCNYKDTIEYISEHLTKQNISHATFYGGMEQIDRERALIKFRNKTHQLLIATDLAARGLDIPELGYIAHYQLPHRVEEFTHRNGRTARMNASGIAYVLQWKEEPLPEFIGPIKAEKISSPTTSLSPANWTTLFISGGRKDKISKGDIAGAFIKTGGLSSDDVGAIEIKQDCAFVAIKKNQVSKALKALDNTRIKKKKVRISEV